MTTAANGSEQIPLGSIKRYLVASGWSCRKIKSGFDLFSKKFDGEDIEIVLPGTSKNRDFIDKIKNAIDTLSILEGRGFEEIISSIRSISYDLIRSRLPESAIRYDTIRLGTAEEFIHRMTRVLAASAHGELHVGPYFVRVDGNAQRYAEECRFGHTFRGSFGFTVESPVGPNTVQNLDDEVPAPPLERRAIRRLARGLRIVESAINTDDPSKIVNGYQDGLNANACEELAALVDVPQVGAVIFDFVFSPEWGFPVDLGRAPMMEIKQKGGVEIIMEAAKELRFVNYEKNRTIIGNVRTLHSLENPSDLFSISGSQDVIVEWESSEYGRRNVRVSLSPQEYLQAVEAHRSGRQISVYGELVQGPRQWRLENPRGFSLV